MTDDQLVAAYFKQLRRAARKLPRARRRELLEEISTHIAEARAAGAGPIGVVLGDLGEPEDIAAAAGAGAAARRAGPMEIAAVILLLLGGFIFLVGWFAGLTLLWASPRWRWPDKLLGTLVWPGGLGGVALFAGLSIAGGVSSQICSGAAGKPMTCTSTSSGGLPAWATVLLAVVALVAPVAVAIRLLLSARSVPAEAQPAAPEPVWH